MSENDEEIAPEDRIQVIASKDPDTGKTRFRLEGLDEVKKDARFGRKLRQALASELSEKYNTNIFWQLDDPDEMVRLAKQFEARGEKRKASTGVVSLKSNEIEVPDPEESPAEFVHFVYTHSRDPDSKYYEIANKVRRHLWQTWKTKEASPSASFDLETSLDPSVKELGNKYTWYQRAEWDKQQAKRKREK